VLVKPRYFHEASTPLRFLNFLKVILPISGVLQVIILLNAWGTEDWYSTGYRIAKIILVIISWIFLYDMKWVGVLTLCGLYLLPAIDGIAVLAILAYHGALEQGGEAFGSILGAIILTSLSWVYFCKRRLLFSPAPAIPATPQEQEPEPENGNKSRYVIVDTETGEVVGEAGFLQKKKKEPARSKGGPAGGRKKNIGGAVVAAILCGAAILVGIYVSEVHPVPQQESTTSRTGEMLKKQDTKREQSESSYTLLPDGSKVWTNGNITIRQRPQN